MVLPLSVQGSKVSSFCGRSTLARTTLFLPYFWFTGDIVRFCRFWGEIDHYLLKRLSLEATMKRQALCVRNPYANKNRSSEHMCREGTNEAFGNRVVEGVLATFAKLPSHAARFVANSICPLQRAVVFAEAKDGVFGYESDRLTSLAISRTYGSAWGLTRWP